MCCGGGCCGCDHVDADVDGDDADDDDDAAAADDDDDGHEYDDYDVADADDADDADDDDDDDDDDDSSGCLILIIRSQLGSNIGLKETTGAANPFNLIDLGSEAPAGRQ